MTYDENALENKCGTKYMCFVPLMCEDYCFLFVDCLTFRQYTNVSWVRI